MFINGQWWFFDPRNPGYDARAGQVGSFIIKDYFSLEQTVQRAQYHAAHQALGEAQGAIYNLTHPYAHRPNARISDIPTIVFKQHGLTEWNNFRWHGPWKAKARR